MNKKQWAAACALSVATGTIVACSSGSPAGNDTKSQVNTKEVHLETIENYEDFNNIVLFCDGTTRVYTTTEFAPVYVTDAPQCGGTGEFTVISGKGS